MDTPPIKGYLFASLVVAIWSGFIVVSRAGGRSPLTAWDVVAIRYAAAVVFLLPVWVRRGAARRFDARMTVLALVGGLGYSLLVFAGFKRAPAADAALLLPGLLPFTIALAARWLLDETPGRGRRVGLGFIAAAAACLAVDARHSGRHLLDGDLLLVGASIAWAVYSVLLRRWRVSPWDATIGVAVLTLGAYAPVYLLFLPKAIVSAPWSDILLQAVYQGLIATVVQMLLYVRTLALIGPTRLGLLMALVPGIAAVAAVPLLGESLTAGQVAGLLLAGIGAWIGIRHSQPVARRPCPT